MWQRAVGSFRTMKVDRCVWETMALVTVSLPGPFLGGEGWCCVCKGQSTTVPGMTQPACAQEYMALRLRAGSQLLRGYGCKDLHVVPGEGGSPGPQDDET